MNNPLKKLAHGEIVGVEYSGDAPLHTKARSTDLHREIRTCLADEEGSATPLAIFWALIFLVLGGLAVDFNKVMSERTQLQIAADSTAHAALYEREFKTGSESKTNAVNAISKVIPVAGFGNALVTSDIEFGSWDEDTLTFTADASSRSAVRVIAAMEADRGNQSGNFLLRFVGFDVFNVAVESVYTTYYPPCFNEGFVAQEVVDIQSNNSYTDGFCIHSNTHVSLNQNNFFEPGTVVSMPSLDDLDMPSSGFEKNEGLQAALRMGEHRLRIIRQLPKRFASLRAGSHKYAAEAGVTSTNAVMWPVDESTKGSGNKTEETTTVERFSSTDTGKKTLKPTAFDLAGRIYQLNCTGNGDITFSADMFRDFALVTNCPVRFSNGTILDGVIIATEGDVDASHVQIGLDDNCAIGGGSQIWTMGNVSTASALSGYGAQILARGDIQFTANASGIEGVSFIAGGRIDGTSNSSMGFCDNDGVENFQRAPYFRMVN